MSNMNVATSQIGNAQVIEISGDLTFNFNEMCRNWRQINVVCLVILISCFQS